jgi:dTDP-4-amino-4,6-dideoxygalactose transaminase
MGCLNEVDMPIYSNDVGHTGHLFFLRFKSDETRYRFIHYMKENGVQNPFHYQALHQSPYARRFDPNGFPNSLLASDTLIRLPIYHSLEHDPQQNFIDKINRFSEFTKT